MTARKAMTMSERYTAWVDRLRPRAKERGSEIKPDPAVIARIKAYIARTMAERYGDHGPP